MSDPFSAFLCRLQRVHGMFLELHTAVLGLRSFIDDGIASDGSGGEEEVRFLFSFCFSCTPVSNKTNKQQAYESSMAYEPVRLWLTRGSSWRESQQPSTASRRRRGKSASTCTT